MELDLALQSGRFSVMNLTAAINNVEVPRMRLAELGLFEERGISETYVDIQYEDGQIMIIPKKERGEDGTKTKGRTRKSYPFMAIHLPLEGSILADSIQGIKAFGSQTELEVLSTKINEDLKDQKSSHEATHENIRIGALLGKIVDSDGSVIEDLFKRFGIKESDATDTIDFSADIGTELLNSKRNSEKAQKGVKGKKYRALCHPVFFDKMLKNEAFKKAFERYNDGAALRDDVRGGFNWQGVIWEEFRGDLGVTDENGQVVDHMPSGQALLFPQDKPKLFLTRYCPANYNETVNTIGLPFYSRSEPKRMGKGVDIETQSNVITVCTAPLAVRRLKIKSGT